MKMIMPETFYSGDSFKLYFSASYSGGWNVNSNGRLAGTVVCLFALSMLLTASAYVNKWILAKFVYLAHRHKQDALVTEKCIGNLLSGCANFVYLGIGYLLMLAVMTFHTGMFLTVVSGIAVGRVIFEHVLKDPLNAKEGNTHNHITDELCH